MANFWRSDLEEPFLRMMETFLLSQNIRRDWLMLFAAIRSKSSTQDVSSREVELVETSEVENSRETIGSDVQGPVWGIWLVPIEHTTSAAARAEAEASEENALCG